ncbi:MBL fold metallo-hydrolase [Chelatococcus sp. SYSU_G07232]|uniref:MBL fold metallo-hydrolase n=1 Tax=Chelatococcus albus TaxID=3047466 RepID=A0ABT7AKA5_9HYPH|nr:MBL fold metallo-hydrolase [Chelatococcus sp. SYSU_G07232]MDJ1159801.1 MBL fold metallo-hydrolase [Chelatococcus sp. SYSU_G07232]
MRLTIVGSGDAFGSGGRFNTCFLLQGSGGTLAVDFGATSLVALKRLGLSTNDIDAVVLSHLHGDHFGGLPFLLLDGQFAARRDKPLAIAGPVGTAERLRQAMEILFPGSSGNAWRFPVVVEDRPCRKAFSLCGLRIESIEVIHPSGAPATALRIGDGERVFAYSGDTTWTDALVDVAAGADLFMCECYKPGAAPANHLGFATIEENRPRLSARRIMLTHMSDDVLDRLAEIEAKGYEIARDGLMVDM